MLHDDIGDWSEVKLAIVREYAKAYSTILAKKPWLHHVYVDAFAGSGTQVSRKTGEALPGTALSVLGVTPPFREYHLVERDPVKATALRGAVGERPDVHIYVGDCNEILPGQIWPSLSSRGTRALCVLDPYGLHLRWEVLRQAGRMGTVEVLLNFSIMDAQRNALWRHPEKASPEQVQRLTDVWGSKEWFGVAYEPDPQLGFWEQKLRKTGPAKLIEAFCCRLREAAGFRHTPNPVPVGNSKGALLYYLVFACQEQVAGKIMGNIFAKYRSQPRLLSD